MKESVEIKLVHDNLYNLKVGKDIKAKEVTIPQICSILADMYNKEENNNGNS